MQQCLFSKPKYVEKFVFHPQLCLFSADFVLDKLIWFLICEKTHVHRDPRSHGCMKLWDQQECDHIPVTDWLSLQQIDETISAAHLMLEKGLRFHVEFLSSVIALSLMIMRTEYLFIHSVSVSGPMDKKRERERNNHSVQCIWTGFNIPTQVCVSLENKFLMEILSDYCSFRWYFLKSWPSSFQIM